MRKSLLSVAILIFLLNGISLYTQLSVKRTKFMTAFNLIATSIIISDMLCGIYLSILLVTDLMYFGEFIVKDISYGDSIQCKVIFTISIMFFIASTCSIVFLSVSRLMVVLYPLNSTLNTLDLKQTFWDFLVLQFFVHHSSLAFI